MPKRSNPFQRLVALLHERIGTDLEVTESRLLTDAITGELREVDVVIQSIVASYPICLSIECRDHMRPADVLWIEGVAMKHKHLPTSKLVLWSRSGFTKAALVKANALKIDAISQAEATQVDWAKLARDLVGGQVQYVTPSYTTFIDIDSSDGVPLRLENVANSSWYKGDGVLAGNVQALIQYLSVNSELRTAVLDNTNAGKGSFYVELKPVEPWFTDAPEGGRVQIRRIGVGIQTFTEHAPLSTASVMAEGKVTTLASADLEAVTFEVLVDESPDGKTTFQAKIVSNKK